MNIPNYFTLQQYDTVTVADVVMPYMKSLYSCLNRIKSEGYTEDFEKSAFGVYLGKSGRVYSLKEFKVINFFRFEGNENATDNVILYIIETMDGLKGTLIKALDPLDNLTIA